MKEILIKNAKVLEVIDGDTFKAELDLGLGLYLHKEVRIKDLDCPEIFRPKSEAERIKGILAKDKAETYLKMEEVTLFIHGIDKYGRILSEVHLYNGKNFSELMIEEGFGKLKK
jgi:endonuclease YncB( thermonuclease family)